MNVYLHDIRLCLEYIDRIEATIRLSQMMNEHEASKHCSY
jgi:hypothetical protein